MGFVWQTLKIKLVVVNVCDTDYTHDDRFEGACIGRNFYVYPLPLRGGVIIRTRSFVFVTTLLFETNASSSSTLISGFNKLYSTVVSVVLSTGGEN